MSLRARLANLSSHSRTHWTDPVAFPADLASGFPIECTFVTDDGRRFRAVRHGKRGIHSIYYRIRATMYGREILTGELSMQGREVEPFRFHRWTADDLQALVPSPFVRLNGIDYTDQQQLELKLVGSSPAHQRWHFRSRAANGFHLLWWADLLHDDPVIPCWGKFVWSDRLDPNYTKWVDIVGIETGEAFVPDFLVRDGGWGPQKRDKWGVTLAPGRTGFYDGAGLPISGRMLSFIGPNITAAMPASTNLGDMSDPNAADVQNLMAGAYGPILGVSLDWHRSRWLGAVSVPRLQRGPDWAEAEATWQRFQGLMAQPANPWADRMWGMSRTPGQTGDQEDFGTTKGTLAVVHGDPRWIQAQRYMSRVEVMRGCHHFEVDGRPLDLAMHPDWVTWSGQTHYHHGVSRDRLGKVDNGWPEPNPMNWFQYDNQHRSQNGNAAHLALTDDPDMANTISHQLTTDMAMTCFKFSNMDAARAEGRTTGAWGHFSTLFNPEDPELTRLLQLMSKRFIVAEQNPFYNAQGPVKVIGVNGPDGRKPVFGANGELLPTWSCWEHGLAVVGYNVALKSGMLPDRATAERVFLTICRTLVGYAIFKDAEGLWHFIADQWYQNDGVANELVATNNKLIQEVGAGGVNTWLLAAIIIAAEALPRTDPLSAKARECVAWATRREEALDIRTAEWWAGVRSIAAITA